MKRKAVLNVVGLTAGLVQRMPRLREFASSRHVLSIVPAFPAVTCTAQSTYLTGLNPSDHGIVGNGWYDRESAEVQFWKQSNRLVHGRKLWEELREIVPGFTCAKLFWWYNMYSTADYSITPRPMYPADGRKIFDIHTAPLDIRFAIKKDLGDFPFRSFWGPGAGISSSQWIADSAKWIEERYRPTLSLVYLPHLDYNLQRLGPSNPAIAGDLEALDQLLCDLIAYLQQRDIDVVVLSEYGISDVDRPIHINRILREQGWIAIKDELGLEMIDCGASKVFAVADHQIAHVYANDAALLTAAREILASQPGVQSVLGRDEQAALGIAHERGGDLVVVADRRSWFTYYYWLDSAVAPDFARTVDIHRKIGYDPAELFIDSAIKFPPARIATFLLKKKLGFRTLLDVIPLDATLVKGSHGRVPETAEDRPLLIIDRQLNGIPDELPAQQVYGVLRAFSLAHNMTHQSVWSE
ncbi:MAG: alkaline phosphatase family protein [Chthoniobacterales bacterium]|nr:alkaline phosphatase family protein [Chthoniobacterales bacterium]